MADIKKLQTKKQHLKNSTICMYLFFYFRVSQKVSQCNVVFNI